MQHTSTGLAGQHGRPQGKSTQHRSGGAVRLGQVVQQLMDDRLCARQSMFEALAESWSQILPQQLGRRCEILDLAGGVLKVRVDSPCYMYELQLCSAELLRELRQRCPGARLKKIKFIVG